MSLAHDELPSGVQGSTDAGQYLAFLFTIDDRVFRNFDEEWHLVTTHFHIVD